MPSNHCLFAFVLSAVLASVSSVQAEQIDTTIAYIHDPAPLPPTLSNLDQPSESQGADGVHLATSENNTTGKFLNQSFAVQTFDGTDGDFTGIDFIVLNTTQENLIAFSGLPEMAGKVLFNVGATENSLRDNACAPNLFHTLPSTAMLADALAQFSVKKKWNKWALIRGPKPADQTMAASLENAANKFGISIVGIKDWTFDADMRRNASQEVPLFTQEFKNHDLIVVADPANDFARYVQYNTWDPRPVAGGAGIKPAGWARSVEQYGAAQLQNRFRELANRQMSPIDYAAWAAVRSIGEAVTRTKTNSPTVIREYLLSDDFSLAGFKGRSLSFRSWNGQLRQPIALAHNDAVVAMAPMEGFLHQRNELDTLGLDKSESTCTVFEGE